MSETPQDPYRPPDPTNPPAPPPPAAPGYGPPPPAAPGYGPPPPAVPPPYGAPPPPYGAQPPQGYPPAPSYPPSTQPKNGVAIAGLVLGVSSLVLFWVPVLDWLLALTGLILSIVGIRKAAQIQVGKGLAIGGLITSIVGLLAAAMFSIFIVFLVNTGIDAYDQCYYDGISQQELDRCMNEAVTDQFIK